MTLSQSRVNLIEQALSTLQPVLLTVKDESYLHEGHAGSKSGGHFSLTIVTALFQGKTAVQRHQMIYEALGDLMKTDIHAISINAKTPEE